MNENNQSSPKKEYSEEYIQYLLKKWAPVLNKSAETESQEKSHIIEN
jgi:hypothetical protein